MIAPRAEHLILSERTAVESQLAAIEAPHKPLDAVRGRLDAVVEAGEAAR